MKNNNNTSYNLATSPINFIIALFTGLVGYHVNVVQGSNWPLFWSIMDFLFWGIAWIKWLICGDVSLTIIKETFSAFLQ